MKKTLSIFALAALVSSAQAVGFSWSLSAIAFDGSTLKSDTGLTASLVYLGNGGTLAASYDIASIGSTLDVVDTKSGTTSKGAISNNYNFDDVADYTTYNGDVYAMLLTYTSGGKTYYNLSSATYTVSGIADERSSIDAFKPTAATFAYGTKTEGSTLTAGGGWVAAVPEPGIACMALLGIGMMIKRRRA